MFRIIKNFRKTNSFFYFMKKYAKHADGVKMGAYMGSSGQHSLFF